MKKQNLLNIGNIDDYMAFLAKLEHSGVVYADPGLAVHINRKHSHELPQEVLADPFKYAKEIISKPDFIGKHPGHGGVELVKRFDQENMILMIGVKYDPKLNYLYVATLHPIEDYKINKRLNKRLHKFNENPFVEAKREAAASNFTKKEDPQMQQDDKTQEIIEKLEKGIKETMESEKWKSFLKVQSQFHHYSFNNTMLIYLQRPDATRVAGFKTWQDKFERFVLKGEKAISILAPCPYKFQKDVEVINKTTGQKEIETRTVEGLRFRKVSVFDVKQTDGKPLPEICQELQGNGINAGQVIKAIKDISEIPIVEKAIDSGAKGYYSRVENIIALKEGMSLDQQAKTLIHEYAHSQLHNTEANALLDRSTKEVQAESVAYIVSNRFGIDTSEYSFEYLAGWSSGKELKELKQSFELIQKTSNQIIEKIEKVLERDRVLQDSPIKVELLWSESKRLWDEVQRVHGSINFSQFNWKPETGIMLDLQEANNIIQKLEQQTRELKTINGIFRMETPIQPGVNDYIYEKSKFMLHTPNYPATEFRFDIGDGVYKNLIDCIRSECHIDVNRYYEDKVINHPSAEGNVLDSIREQYKEQYSAIKYISEKTAHIIDNLNKQHGSTLSIDQIKDMYKVAGKRVEGPYNEADMEEFKTLKDVVDDLKQAKLEEKHEQAKQKSAQAPIKENDMIR